MNLKKKDGKWKPVTVVENLNEPRSHSIKTESRSMYKKNQRHLLKTESGEDQTTELSDDEDKAKFVQVKYDVANDEERIVELKKKSK